MFARTGQPAWTGLVAAAGSLPIGLLAPIGGALADRFDRRRWLIATTLAEMSFATMLAVLAAVGVDRPAVLVLFSFLGGASGAIGFPAYQAMVPDLVPADDLLGAVSLSSAQFNLGRVVGPALAGLALLSHDYRWSSASMPLRSPPSWWRCSWSGRRSRSTPARAWDSCPGSSSGPERPWPAGLSCRHRAHRRRRPPCLAVHRAVPAMSAAIHRHGVELFVGHRTAGHRSGGGPVAGRPRPPVTGRAVRTTRMVCRPRSLSCPCCWSPTAWLRPCGGRSSPLWRWVPDTSPVCPG